MAQDPHVCPDPSRGMLPMIIADAAVKGNQTEVLNWLEKGGDINAADLNGRTLVYQACYFNHLQLLRELLKHPDVHLDQWIPSTSVPAQKRFLSPLREACLRGHLECVEVLLKSPSKCQIDLNKNHISALLKTLANNNHWGIVELFFKAGFPLMVCDAYQLLHSAVSCGERDIIKYIIEKEFTFEEQNLGNILQEICDRDLTDAESIDKLFKKVVLTNNDTAKTMLRSVLDKRDWKRLEALLHMMTEDASINVTLCEAVLGNNSENVERILKEEEPDDTVRSGALFVASIGGTTEEIADSLLDQKYNYSGQILGHVLILASMNGRLEIIQTLLQRSSFTYNTLWRARFVARKEARELVARAVKKESATIVPLEKDD